MTKRCFCSNAAKYYQKELFCDVVLVADQDGTRIKAHRMTLCSANDYFESLFNAEMKEKNMTEISLKEIDGKVLKALVEYCYTGQIAINQENIHATMAGASMYQFSCLAEQFQCYFRESICAQNCLGFWGSARQNAYNELDRFAFEFACEHFTDVTNADEFLVLGIELLLELLSNDRLEVDSEEDVFNSIEKWVNFDAADRKVYFGSLIETVRMTEINYQFLFKNIHEFCTLLEAPDIYMHACELRKTMAENIVQRHEKFPNFLSIGGSHGTAATIEQYNSKSDSWQSVHNIQTNIKNFGTESIENQLYLIGGKITFVPTNKVYCLTLDTLQLTSKALMIHGRSSFATVLLNDCIYAIGGDGDAHSVEGFGSVERYNIKTNKWSEVASLSINRYDHSACVLSGKIYVVGGTKHCIVLNSVERYDPETNVWTTVTSMNTKRSNYGCCVINNCLYAVGGFNNCGSLSSIERYDETTDTWTMIEATLPMATWSFGILAHGYWIYVAGGVKNNIKFVKINVITGEKIQMCPMICERSHFHLIKSKFIPKATADTSVMLNFVDSK